VHAAQAKNGGAMISFELSPEYDIKRFLESLELITMGASLGGVESLIGHPATTSHRSLPKDLKEVIGITDRLIRLSPGIEDVSDIIADLEHGFEAAR
jgi:cystathionine beta-lyase